MVEYLILSRYRKVAEEAVKYRRGWDAFWKPGPADMPVQAEADLDAALVAIGMKVEEDA